MSPNDFKTDKELEDKVDRSLQKLKQSIKERDFKTQNIIAEWFESKWSKYIVFEKNFKPELNKKYNHGDIVTVELGFNVGSEEGGPHPAVVIDYNNNKSSANVMVVPLSSFNEDRDIKKSEVYLGEIKELNNVMKQENGTKSIAKVSQMRSISKLRIIYPRKTSHNTVTLPNQCLKQIKNKIFELYL